MWTLANFEGVQRARRCSICKMARAAGLVPKLRFLRSRWCSSAVSSKCCHGCHRSSPRLSGLTWFFTARWPIVGSHNRGYRNTQAQIGRSREKVFLEIIYWLIKLLVHQFLCRLPIFSGLQSLDGCQILVVSPLYSFPLY